MKQGQIVLGVLAGIAAGAVLGILFAPDKGTITRKKILCKSLKIFFFRKKAKESQAIFCTLELEDGGGAVRLFH